MGKFLTAFRKKRTSAELSGRTVRIAYVTSPRELYVEGVGIDKRIEPTLEFLQRKITAGNPWVSKIKIAAVFVDDDGKEFNRHELAATTRTFNRLRSFCKQNDIKFQVECSRNWRKLPVHVTDENGNRIKNPAKHKAKVPYEEKMLSFMRKNNIDIIFSDSYMCLFDSVMLDPVHGYRDLIINLHPGIASEVPGMHPTRDSLAQLRAATGATLHLVDELIDHGRTILVSSGTPIRKGDNERDLRARNYATKNKTLLHGIRPFLNSTRTQKLIAENRMKNRAHNLGRTPAKLDLSIFCFPFFRQQEKASKGYKEY